MSGLTVIARKGVADGGTDGRAGGLTRQQATYWEFRCLRLGWHLEMSTLLSVLYDGDIYDRKLNFCVLHISPSGCVTLSMLSDRCMREYTRPSWVQIMVRCCQLAYGNKLQWSLNRTTATVVQGNAFENIVCKIRLDFNVLTKKSLKFGIAIILWAVHSQYTGLILGFLPASEKRRSKVTPSFIGWA